MADKLYELETKSIYKLLKSYYSKETTLNELLFVNFYPSTILHPEFPKFIETLLEWFPIIKNKMVIEIIESEKIDNVFELRKHISILKDFARNDKILTYIC